MLLLMVYDSRSSVSLRIWRTESAKLSSSSVMLVSLAWGSTFSDCPLTFAYRCWIDPFLHPTYNPIVSPSSPSRSCAELDLDGLASS